MNILVVRNDKLGDFITALPTMYVLKQYNPTNRIIACVSPLNKTLAQSMPFIDEVKEVEYWRMEPDLSYTPDGWNYTPKIHVRSWEL